MALAITTATVGRDWAERGSVATRELTEKEVVERAREGDHEAFRLLVRRHETRVHGLALRILRDPEWARDAAQDAFLKAYRSLRRFEGRSSFGTWMYRLTYNHCLDLKRRDKSSRLTEWDEERIGSDAAEPHLAPGTGPSAPAPAPELAMQRSELGGQLQRALESLPEEARQILLLREVDGLSYAEIAEVQGIPKGTVMSRLFNARKRAREALRSIGVTPAGEEIDE